MPRKPKIATALAACPHCGAAPGRHWDAEQWAWVECPSCGARTAYKSDANDADAAWNMRTAA
jgi:Zn ribbon nucleic-acid-binding protein